MNSSSETLTALPSAETRRSWEKQGVHRRIDDVVGGLGPNPTNEKIHHRCRQQPQHQHRRTHPDIQDRFENLAHVRPV